MQNAEVSARLLSVKQIPSGESVMADSNSSVPASADERETRIRQPQMGSHHAKAGHVERVEAHPVGNARRNHVEHAGC